MAIPKLLLAQEILYALAVARVEGLSPVEARNSTRLLASGFVNGCFFMNMQDMSNYVHLDILAALALLIVTRLPVYIAAGLQKHITSTSPPHCIEGPLIHW